MISPIKFYTRFIFRRFDKPIPALFLLKEEKKIKLLFYPRINATNMIKIHTTYNIIYTTSIRCYEI